MDKKVIIGNVCFIKDEKNNKILLLKRNREPMQNMLTGIGGKTDFEEDINSSCVREVKEETGLNVNDIKLKGIIKTILDGNTSSWLLFVYTAENFNGELINCNEGELMWIDLDKIYSYDLIGFIKKILPSILVKSEFIEGMIRHDIKGNVIDEKLNIIKFGDV